MIENIRSDFARYRRYGCTGNILKIYADHQGLWAMICYRAGRYLYENPLPFGLKQIASAFYFIWWKLIQITTGIYISPTVKIGKGFFVGHFGQILIGGDVVIGEDCNVAQGVSIGYAYNKGVWGVPKLGNRVFVAAGAMVIGPIEVADGTVIGANAVLTKDTEKNSVVAGVPARVISKKGSEKYIY